MKLFGHELFFVRRLYVFSFDLFIYSLSLVALGLLHCAQTSSGCSELGLLFSNVWLLTVVASLAAEWTQWLRHMGIVALQRVRIEPMSSTLAGRLLSTVPLGSPVGRFFITVLVSLLTYIGLFKFSVFSLFSLGRLYVSNHFSISSRVSNF